MGDAISASENALVHALLEKGVDVREATVAIIILTRTYCRPMGDLVQTLRQYPLLDDTKITTTATYNLIQRGWLTIETSYGVDLVGPAPDLRAQVAEFLGRPTLEDDLLRMLRLNDEYVTIVGPLRDRHAFVSYLSLLRTAQSHIYFSGIATSALDHEATPIILQRSKAGVSVRVILAEPRLTARLRGSQMLAPARARIKEWETIAKQGHDFRVRLTSSPEDLLFASSASIDSRVLRLVVYDFAQERSKQGIVVEFSTHDNRSLNAVIDFERHFLEAWDRAKPAGLISRMFWYLRKTWQIQLALILATLSYLFYELQVLQWIEPIEERTVTLAIAILTSAAGSFLFSALVDLGRQLRTVKALDLTDGSEK